MRQPRRTLVRLTTLLLAVTALYTATASSASAAWFIEGGELSGTAALATTAKVTENFKLTAAGVTTECSGGTLNATSPEIKAPNLILASSLTFNECKATGGNCTLATKTIGTLPLQAELSELAYPEDKATFTPKTKTTLAALHFEGASCALLGVQPVTGKALATLPTGQEEKTPQLLKVNTTGASKDLKLGSSEATLTGATELKLATGKPWGSSPSPAATNCPIKSEGVTFKATVTVGNEASLREEVVNDTRIPVGESGTCSSIAKYTTGVSEGKITTSQSEAYKAKIAELVVPGATIYAFKWHENSGSKETFETLGIFSTSGEGKFEPIGSWGGGSTAESTPAVEGAAGDQKWGPLTWTQYTLLGTTGYEAKMNYEIIFNGANEITNKTSLISFYTGFGWNAAATKEEELLVVGGVNCNKVTVTITFVTGFKSLKVTAGGGGFSGSVEVTGFLGANGQHQEADTLCVDGTKKRLIA